MVLNRRDELVGEARRTAWIVVRIDDDNASLVPCTGGTARVDPCPSSSVEHHVVEGWVACNLRDIEGSPRTIGFADSHDGVALVVTHPQVVL